MKIILRIIFFIFFVSCAAVPKTKMTGAERCALIEQVQLGTQIGSQTQVSSIGKSVYSYSIPSYNTICVLPKTEEERKAVQELHSKAKETQKKILKENLIYMGGLMIGTPLAILILGLLIDF